VTPSPAEAPLRTLPVVAPAPEVTAAASTATAPSPTPLSAPVVAPLAPTEAPTIVRAASPEAAVRTLEAVIATVRDLSTPERPSIEAVIRDAEMGTLTIRASIERGTVRAEITVTDPGHARAIADAARERAATDVSFAAISIDVRSGNGRAREEQAERSAGPGPVGVGRVVASTVVQPTTSSADGRLDLYA
jgi:hypothetical protein